MSALSYAEICITTLSSKSNYADTWSLKNKLDFSYGFLEIPIVIVLSDMSAADETMSHCRNFCGANAS